METIANFKNRIERIQSGYKHCNAIPSGFKQLDESLNGGFAGGSIYMISGCSKAGRTTFFVSLVSNIIQYYKNTNRVGIISFDITKDEFVERTASNISKIWFEKIRRGKLSTDEVDVLRRDEIQELLNQISFSDNCSSNINNLVSSCEDLIVKERVSALFIDDVEMMNVLKSEPDKFEETIRSLKKLSVEFDIPILISVGFEKNPLIVVNAAKQITDVSITLKRSNDFNDYNFDNIPIHGVNVILQIQKNAFGLLDSILLQAYFHIQSFVEKDFK